MQELFPDDWETILTCAFYLADEGRDLRDVKTWCTVYRAPCRPEELDCKNLRDLLPLLDRERQACFFQRWMKLHPDRVCAFEITPVPSYRGLRDPESNEYLSPTHMFLMTGTKSGLPLDLRSVPADPVLFEQGDALFVLDQGFYGEKIIEAMIRHPRYQLETGDHLLYGMTVEGDHVYRHLIFDPDGASQGRESCENRFGWFVMISSHVKDVKEVIRLYRSRLLAQRCFDDLKNEQDTKKLGLMKNRALEGRIFLQFLGVALKAQIRRIMDAHPEFRDMTVQELIWETRTVRHVTLRDTGEKFTTELTPMQKAICKAFEISLQE